MDAYCTDDVVETKSPPAWKSPKVRRLEERLKRLWPHIQGVCIGAAICITVLRWANIPVSWMTWAVWGINILLIVLLNEASYRWNKLSEVPRLEELSEVIGIKQR